jgi:hypothetical protein
MFFLEKNFMSRSLVKVKTNNDDDELLAKLGEKLAKSSSAQEIVLLTQVRGEIIRQDLDSEKKSHEIYNKSQDRALKRFNEKATLIFRIAMSPVALIVGCGLIYLGFLSAGYLALGAGLWLLASELVRGYLLGGGKNSEK